jgi:hypothetical protein
MIQGLAAVGAVGDAGAGACANVADAHAGAANMIAAIERNRVISILPSIGIFVSGATA